MGAVVRHEERPEKDETEAGEEQEAHECGAGEGQGATGGLSCTRLHARNRPRCGAATSGSTARGSTVASPTASRTSRATGTTGAARATGTAGFCEIDDGDHLARRVVVPEGLSEDERAEPADRGVLFVVAARVDHDTVADREPLVGTGNEVEILRTTRSRTRSSPAAAARMLTLWGSRCNAPSSKTPAAEGVSAEVSAEPPTVPGS
ncbi:MAG: hypothetical protein M5T61_18640 [Acidimicrobiia bacterium]|nr:hypothetical protein [Acidimicrobiia bacterium]